jgi:hypothetical protein
VGFLCISGKPFLGVLKGPAHPQYGLSIWVIPGQADALSNPFQLDG